MPKPLSFYTTSPIAQALTEQHGEYLEKATEQQLRELMTCYSAGMVAARSSDLDSLHLISALAGYLEHRTYQPIIRIESTGSVGEPWV